MARATFAAGCFWGVEAAFRNLPGVVATRVGYTGGTTPNPSYEQVCTDHTGHAEAVDIEFDERRVSYRQLLDVFWQIHDPTQLNRQGPDVGSQYRSAVFAHDDGQREEALASKERAQASRRRPIVTEVVAASTFWEAEEYHQRYYEKHGIAGCHVSLS